MARKGGHVGEEDMHINPLDDSDSKPTKTVVPVKRGRGRPRKEENAVKNEGLLLNQGLHQVPAMSLESQKRSRRKGKQMARSSDEEEVSQHKIQLPITFMEGIKVLNYTYLILLYCVYFVRKLRNKEPKSDLNIRVIREI